jgi:hypothetical protein
MSHSHIRPAPSITNAASSAQRTSAGDLHARISSAAHAAVPSPSVTQTRAAHEQIRNRLMADSFQSAAPRAPVDLGGASSAGPAIQPGGPSGQTTPATYTSTSPVDPPTGAQPTGSLDSGAGDNAQVDQWILQAEQKMGRNFTAEEERAIRVIAYHEARNDPSASNDWDVNAQQGNPSQGLMQVTQSNFQQYNPGGNIFDPVDSIIVAVRYSDERYGGSDKSKGYVDWKNGGATDPYGGWNGGYTWY